MFGLFRSRAVRTVESADLLATILADYKAAQVRRRDHEKMQALFALATAIANDPAWPIDGNPLAEAVKIVRRHGLLC